MRMKIILLLFAFVLASSIAFAQQVQHEQIAYQGDQLDPHVDGRYVVYLKEAKEDNFGKAIAFNIVVYDSGKTLDTADDVGEIPITTEGDKHKYSNPVIDGRYIAWLDNNKDIYIYDMGEDEQINVGQDIGIKKLDIVDKIDDNDPIKKRDYTKKDNLALSRGVLVWDDFDALHGDKDVRGYALDKFELIKNARINLFLDKENVIEYNGKEYNVKLTYIDGDRAIVIVNGQVSPYLRVGTDFTFADGTFIAIVNTFPADNRAEIILGIRISIEKQIIRISDQKAVTIGQNDYPINEFDPYISGEGIVYVKDEYADLGDFGVSYEQEIYAPIRLSRSNDGCSASQPAVNKEDVNSGVVWVENCGGIYQIVLNGQKVIQGEQGVKYHSPLVSRDKIYYVEESAANGLMLKATKGDLATNPVSITDRRIDLDRYRIVFSERGNDIDIGAINILGSNRPLSEIKFPNAKPIPPPIPPKKPRFTRGDSDGSGIIDLTDAIFILNYLFAGQKAPSCMDSADANDDGQVDLSDAVTLLQYMFLGGTAPASPFMDAQGNLIQGEDTTQDNLGCEITAFISGESVNLATASQKLHYKSKLNDAVTAISKNELPNLLADGVLTDFGAVQYSYMQSILIGASVIEYGTSGGDLNDPVLHINVGTSSDKPVYTYRVTFNKDINVLDQNIPGSKLILLGKEYTLSRITTNPLTLQLVDKDGDILILEDGKAVSFNGDIIQGTRATIYFQRGSIVAFDVFVAMQQSVKDHVAIGDVFTDPVFGIIELGFEDVTPNENSQDRDDIKVDTDGNIRARVTFTPATLSDNFPIGCSAGGGPGGPGPVTCSNTFSYARDTDTSTSTVTPLLQHDLRKLINVEGDIIRDIGDVIIINSGDKGRIVEVDAMPEGGALTFRSQVILKDFFTQEKIADPFVGTAGETTVTIDGETYFIKILDDHSSMVITWGKGASSGSVGDVTTIYPRIKTKKGAWVSFLTMDDVVRFDRLSLPGIEDVATYEAGIKVSEIPGKGSFKLGNVNYLVDGNIIFGIDINNDGKIVAGVDCDFSIDKGPAVLIQEEKKLDENGNDINGDIICIPLSTFGITVQEIAISDPVVTNVWSQYHSWTSDPFEKTAVTRYGSFIEKKTQDNEQARILYPDEQMTADILIGG